MDQTVVQKGCENSTRYREDLQRPLMRGLDGGDRKRILVIDDDGAIRDIVSKILSCMGYDVAIAADGIEGFELFAKSPFHLVLTDFDMPYLDGLELAKQIKGRSADTPVILMTGREKDEIEDALNEKAIDSAMFKPFRLDDIEGAIQGIL